ncbi:MAG: membrane protein insertion efficiency factor YidD [Acidimicrobiia bacterium]
MTVKQPSIGARMIATAIRVYQILTSWMPPRCRYYPSCSNYALDAVRKHGAWRGTGLAIRRIGRCHPWHDGGVDHVPDHLPTVH